MKTHVGDDIERAAWYLSQGAVIGVPTETVYGLAGNAYNRYAIDKIYSIKNRPILNPLIVHVKDIDSMYQFASQIPEEAIKLMEKHCPGPLTVVLPIKESKISRTIYGNLPTIALRIPSHPIFLNLLNIISFPLAAPSANPSGYISPTSASHVYQQLSKQIPYILDGGECKIGIESTIVSFISKRPKLLRYGFISPNEIQEVIPDIEIPDTSKTQTILAPGMMEKHYAPKKPLYVGKISTLIKNFKPDEVAIIHYSNNLVGHKIENSYILSLDNSLHSAAQRLYFILREIDEREDIKYIIVEPVLDEGIGKAINDKLRRASITHS